MFSSVVALLALLCATTIIAEPTFGQQSYLAPHEQRVFDALDNVNYDFQGFKDVFAKNAYCELNFNDINGNVVTKSGTFNDVLSSFSAMTQYKVKWESVTNSHAKHPEMGVLGVMWWNYGLTEKGCEGLFSGIGTIHVSVPCSLQRLVLCALRCSYTMICLSYILIVISILSWCFYQTFYCSMRIHQFDNSGLVTQWRGYSTDFLDFFNCVEKERFEKDTVLEK